MSRMRSSSRYKFIREVTYIILQLIPMGKVTTYGALAKFLKTSPRLIGKIMKENKRIIVIPCHRVVKSNGDIGGYSLGLEFKRKILELEGVRFSNGRVCKEQIITDVCELIDP